jgi:hypothetical protein
MEPEKNIQISNRLLGDIGVTSPGTTLQKSLIYKTNNQLIIQPIGDMRGSGNMIE